MVYKLPVRMLRPYAADQLVLCFDPSIHQGSNPYGEITAGVQES
jgi:hypothetical protein